MTSPQFTPRAGRLAGAATMLSTAYRADPLRAIGVFVLYGGSSVAAVASSWFVKSFTDAAVARDVAAVTSAAIGFAVISALSNLTLWISFSLRVTLIEKSNLLFDKRIIDVTAGIPGIEHHERRDYADELALLRQGKAQLASVTDYLVLNLGTALRLLTTSVLLAGIHPALVLLPLFGGPSLYLSGRAQRQREAQNEATMERNRLANHLFTTVMSASAAKELRIFGIGEELIQRRQELRHRVMAEQRELAWRLTGVGVFGWVVFRVGYLVAIVVVTAMAVAGTATTGDVLLTLRLAGQLNGDVSSVSSLVQQLLQLMKMMRRYLWLREYAEDATPNIAAAIPAPDALVDGITIDNVTFVYPGTEKPVLDRLSVHLPAGTTIAIVGDNGAGKTTLIKLLCRLYEPTSGSILVDGVDLARLDHEAWRARLAAGFQDFARFELLARETVGVGDLPYIESAETVRAALDRASAADVVADLRHGLESQVGRSFEDGHELSGGQWQKLALGRAMMRERPLLLVLDEPTASLDAHTEHALFEHYAGAAQRVAAINGAITVLVSHRFSTVRMADLIIVVSDGGVVEVGTHEDLLQRGGLYAELFELQARGYR